MQLNQRVACQTWKAFGYKGDPEEVEGRPAAGVSANLGAIASDTPFT
jgi:hypothetical protein